MKLLSWTALIFLLSLSFMACEEDPCETVTCLNGGSCVGLGTCECQPGFEGDSCQTFALANFLGTYEVVYGGCFVTTANHQVGIEQVQGQSRQIYLNDLGDYDCPGGRIQVLAEVEGTSLTIAEQTIDCSGQIAYTFSGGGELQGNTISLTFKVTYDADGIAKEDNCTATLEK
ncbi:MAG: calcium-binding EGF-like domain-containing protein [Bacteroidota bacterium]